MLTTTPKDRPPEPDRRLGCVLPLALVGAAVTLIGLKLWLEPFRPGGGRVWMCFWVFGPGLLFAAWYVYRNPDV